MRKILKVMAVTVIGIALTALFAVVPVTESVAAANYKLVSVSVKTTINTKLDKYSYSSKRPTVQGVPAKVKKIVDKKVAAFYKGAQVWKQKEDANCKVKDRKTGKFKSNFDGAFDGTIYRNRYLSVIMWWGYVGIGGCNAWFGAIGGSLNIDLKTGKTVKLSKFVKVNDIFWGISAKGNKKVWCRCLFPQKERCQAIRCLGGQFQGGHCLQICRRAMPLFYNLGEYQDPT
jgi:hypothetical protein